MNGKALTNIQILRAFAALNVVLFHIISGAVNYGYGLSILAGLANWGSSGVDLFFVISGFVMIYIQHYKHKTPVAFFSDRLLRIAPTYWFLSLLLALLLVTMPSIFRQMNFSISWLASSLFFVSRAVEQQQPILFVGWTIEYEMLFYLIFSISLFVSSLLISLLLTLAGIFAAIVVFHADPMMLEFGLGMLIGLGFVHQIGMSKFGLPALLLGTVLLLLSIAVKDSGLNRVIVYGIPSALIVFGCINCKQVKKNILTKIGDASYSIYLIQIFTLPAFYKFVTMIHLNLLNADVLALICLCITALSGLFFYDIFEVWVSNWAKRIKSGSKNRGRSNQT